MKTLLAVLVALTVSACSSHRESNVWKMTLTEDGAPFGSLRQARPDAVRKAAQTYEQFLTELDARYFKEVDFDRVTIHAMHGALARLNAHGEVARLDAPLPCKTELGIGATLTRNYQNDILISHLALTSPLAGEGVRAGARILAVDDASTNLLTSSETAGLIICNGDTNVMLTIEQDGVMRTVYIEKRVNQFAKMLHVVFPGNIHYVWISSLSEFGTASRAIAILEAARKTPDAGVILDLRSMNGGYVAASKILLSMFVPPGSVALWYNETPITVPDLRTPLANPMVVLINGRTASVGEVLALALQDHERATIIGWHTAGFGTALGEATLPDQSTAYIPHVIYRGPKKTSIEGVGVVPDIIVRDTSPYGYFKDGYPDAILATALAHLRDKYLQYAKAP